MTGPDGQVFTYTIDFDGKVDWETDPNGKPVNFTVLGSYVDRNNKWRKIARVFHFGVEGQHSDTDEQSRGVHNKVVRFCYGLSRPPEPDMINLGDCGELMKKQGSLNGTEVLCPAQGQERAVISLDITPPAHPDDRKDFTLQFCTCNFHDPDTGSSRLPQCDPELSRDQNDQNNACTNNADGTNTRVPILIQGVENPSSYICFTSGGRRVCYGHF